MSTSDGTILGTTKIVDHGPATSRWNLVILGDGYRSSEMTKYHTDVQNLIDAMYATPPFDELWCGINVYRVDVASTDSGADDPTACSGSGATVNTYFDATFCGDGQIQRLLTCNNTTARSVAMAQVPQFHMVMVIVNSSIYGGSGGSVATFSTATGAAEIGLHEMGHTAFGLADEYEYWAGCGSGETGHDTYTGGEPTQPNITHDANRATNKWNTLILGSTAMPTTSNANCAQCDPQANPVAAGTVGAFEGAGYFHCGMYRPEFTCRMRALNNPYCAVCQGVIRSTLQPFLPAESLTLTTPSITFANIPEGLGGTGVTTFRAIVWEVVSCTAKTFRITSGPTGPFGTPLGTVSNVPVSVTTPVAYGRIWLSYTSTHAGDSASGSVTVHCDETGQTWVINITANTVVRPKSAVALVLDHSGSMSDDAGDGTIKVQKLREAANIFVNVMQQGDAVSIVRFDDTSQRLMNVTDVGPVMIGAGRLTAIGQINSPSLDPAGATSIGAGVVQGKQALDDGQAAASPPYDILAMVVLTDGMENTPPMLSAVGSSITSRTFAIGLGLPQNISTAALNTLTQGNNGYLLVTGTLTPDQAARLNKYFLQILAGITNANVVLDPTGELTAGAEHRIPFLVSEADYGIEVILLCPLPQYVDFQLETPDGTRLNPASVTGLGTGEFALASGVSYYRVSLPSIPADAVGSHAGTWYVVLKLGRVGRGGLDVATHAENILLPAAMVARKALPYDLVVHTYSNLNFAASLTQSSYEPGAVVTLHASLREYDAPVENRAGVWAEVTLPNGGSALVSLSETGPGEFSAPFQTSLAGLYVFRVRAKGETFYGMPFSREQTLTAAVYPGGDRPPKDPGGDSSLCDLLECLLQGGVVNDEFLKRLEALGLNVKALLRCLEKRCRQESTADVERRRAVRPVSATGLSAASYTALLNDPQSRAALIALIKEAMAE